MFGSHQVNVITNRDYGSCFRPSGSVCSNDSRQSQQSLHSPTSETTTFQLGHYDTDSGHNSIVSSNYDSHSSSSISSTNSPPVEKRPPAIVVAPNMAAMVTVTSASTSVPQCQVGSSSAAVRSMSEFPGGFGCTGFMYIYITSGDQHSSNNSVVKILVCLKRAVT